MKLKKLIKKFIPPILLELYNNFATRKYGWHGDYNSWETAQNESIGYDSSIIIEKVRDALLKVKKGEAAYERDSVLFDKVEYSWLVLLSLLLASSNNKLNVLDFGGSLGSTYFQNKLFLDEIGEVVWNIVEQKKFIEYGKKDFENKILKFYNSIEECHKENKPDILLLLSVLQYIKNVDDFIQEILEYDYRYIVIDRTPFTMNNRDIITVQTVSPDIYKASYPSRILCYEKLISKFSSKYKILFENYSNENIIKSDSVDIHFKGIIFKRL